MAEVMTMQGTTYGYARVSTSDQNLDRQYDALLDFGVERRNIFADKASGKNFERPAYIKMKDAICAGDLLVITSIDRLGRNYNQVLDEWRTITKERKVSIVVLDMPLLDTRETQENLTGKLIADIMVQLLSYVAEVERKNIKQRQAEGIAAAKARGVRFGRPPIKRPRNFAATVLARYNGQISRSEAAQRSNVSRATYDRWERQLEDDYAASTERGFTGTFGDYLGQCQ